MRPLWTSLPLLLASLLHVEGYTCPSGKSKETITLAVGESVDFSTQETGTYGKNVKCLVKFKRGRRSKCKLNFSCTAFTLTAKNSNCNKGSDFMKIGRDKFCEDNSPDVTINGRTLNVLFRSHKKSKGGAGAECTATCIDPQEASTSAPTDPPTITPPPATTAAPTTGNGSSEVRQNILNDHFSFWRAFRDPQNGAWCDSLYHPDHPWLDPDVEEFEEMTPCGAANNFYSSAGMGMGLVSEATAVELGIQTREDGKARVRQTLETVLASWPRETTHGFLQHFTTREMNVISEFSTIDSAILTLGALFAGNYFGGEVASLAQDLLESVQWSDAIEAADSPRIFPVVDKNSGDMAGYVAPYNEYYLVAYLANMTSPPGSKAAQHFATFMGNAGAPPGANGHPVPITYEGFTLLTDNYNNYFMSSFIPQFNYYLARGCQTSPFQLKLFSDWMQADKLFWSTALPSDATIWGTEVVGKVWGAGAGPAPSGYGVERINESTDLVISAAIMAGFLPAAPTEELREEINQQLDWLYTNNVCAYPWVQGGKTIKILWRCSVRLPDWRSGSIDSIDFSTFIHGYSTNFLPADFYQTYSA